MVIQRWQSVFLLLAAVCMGLASFLSLGQHSLDDAVTVGVCALDYLPLFAVNILVLLLLLIDIFLYKNLRLQKRVAMVGIILEIVSVVNTALLMLPSVAMIDVMSWAATLPVVSLILTILARSRMVADERLLKSCDRIR